MNSEFIRQLKKERLKYLKSVLAKQQAAKELNKVIDRKLYEAIDNDSSTKGKLVCQK